MAYGAHKVVAHTERERERAERVQPAKKEIDFEYRKLFSIQHITENNSKEICRSLQKI
jgi:putative IMPACT (imprinted ancient) family translation regulator